VEIERERRETGRARRAWGDRGGVRPDRRTAPRSSLLRPRARWWRLWRSWRSRGWGHVVTRHGSSRRRHGSRHVSDLGDSSVLARIVTLSRARGGCCSLLFWSCLTIRRV